LIQSEEIKILVK